MVHGCVRNSPACRGFTVRHVVENGHIYQVLLFGVQSPPCRSGCVNTKEEAILNEWDEPQRRPSHVKSVVKFLSGAIVFCFVFLFGLV